ncbi:MAG: PLD nuclease N-terminal domain-containing protein [bacterium]|nr:PLD nuclease N-terminal domain-containing protein [bacterium]
MAQEKSKIWSAVIVTLVVVGVVSNAVVMVGSGVYYFKSKTIEASQVKVWTPSRETTQALQKSVGKYIMTRESFLNKEMIKDPDALGFKKLVTIKMTCPDSAGTPCGFDLLIVSKDSVHPGNQEFYLARTMGFGYTYYGPFTDDLEKIVNDGRKMISFNELTGYLSEPKISPTLFRGGICTLNGHDIPCKQMPKGFFSKPEVLAGMAFIGLIGVLGIFGFIFSLWMLIDVAKNEKENKAMWLVLIILSNLTGAIIYYFVQKRKRVKVRSN